MCWPSSRLDCFDCARLRFSCERQGNSLPASWVPFLCGSAFLASTSREWLTGEDPGVAGALVPQVGDAVRYFPQLHVRGPLQDRAQLWQPRLFKPVDCRVIDVQYIFPG
eukprot:GHVT01029542.1.p1 GENE.GHVT01029542.1~~GHVT01029542.1.p1  ORF type:complete len:109 (-),score=12.84 GHVT01029542.1:445-771(-)